MRRRQRGVGAAAGAILPLRGRAPGLACAQMVKGQKVICGNDVFSPTVRALYKQLPVKEEFVGDAMANRLRGRAMRSPWSLV